jgi:predicted nucleic acid-binding protein
MNGFLLDTNIPSEMTRLFPQPSVVQWLENAEDNQLYFSVISIGEISKGITTLPASYRRTQLQQWLNETLRPWLQDRVLPVTEPIAERWGVLTGECKMKGRPLKVEDGLIAATALEHSLTVVTRNTRDFEGLEVAVLNPWN